MWKSVKYKKDGEIKYEHIYLTIIDRNIIKVMYLNNRIIDQHKKSLKKQNWLVRDQYLFCNKFTEIIYVKI